MLAHVRVHVGGEVGAWMGRMKCQLHVHVRQALIQCSKLKSQRFADISFTQNELWYFNDNKNVGCCVRGRVEIKRQLLLAGAASARGKHTNTDCERG